jgi:hypothetical protein
MCHLTTFSHFSNRDQTLRCHVDQLNRTPYQRLTYSHTHQHTHARTCTHTNTCAHTHTHRHARARTHTLSHTLHTRYHTHHRTHTNAHNELGSPHPRYPGRNTAEGRSCQRVRASAILFVFYNRCRRQPRWLSQSARPYSLINYVRSLTVPARRGCAPPGRNSLINCRGGA